MDVPHRVLSELSDVYTVLETSKVYVVVIRACNDELLVTVGQLYNMDVVYHSAMSLYEPTLDNLVWVVIDSEGEIGKVPKFDAACCVPGNKVVIVTGSID